MSEEKYVKPITSPKRDLKQLSANSQATVGELRDFLATLKGKSPKDMMGAVADSKLAKSLFQATGIMFLLLVALTAYPYALKEDASANESEENPSSERGDAPAKQPEQTEKQSNLDAAEKPTSPEQDTADKLGIGDEKASDPNANPLDSKDDDLLDGLDDL